MMGCRRQNIDCREVLESFKTVSRRHIRITCENGIWLAEDLNTSNAT